MDDARIAVKSISSRLALALAAALVVVPAAASGPAAEPNGYFAASSTGSDGQSLGYISISSADAVAQVIVTAPAGYVAKLEGAPGTEIGFVFAGLSDVPGTTSASASGELVAQDPARQVGTPRAEACAPGLHTAVWTAPLSVLGQSFELELYVDQLAGGGVQIRFCPVWPSATLPAGVTADDVTLFLENVLAAPTEQGRYTWSALVSPPRSDLTADTARTFELRSTEPVPYALTLRSKYDAGRKTVVLSGRLLAAGEPQAGVEIDFAASRSSLSETTFFGPVKTDASGAFSITRRVEVTTQFTASAPGFSGPCAAPSQAPAGCIRETVASPSSATAFVRVRSAADPKLVPKRIDQALARRANLSVADFPTGWRSIESFPFFACKGFAPRLSDLTATGDIESPVFVSNEAVASSRATVYLTEAQARTAFARTARLALARCVAEEVKADGAKVLQLGATTYPALGSETRAFRVVYGLEDFVVTLDFVSFRQGRTVVHLGFGSVAQPHLIADEIAL